MNNKGDWGLNSPEADGSSPDKPHVMHPVSMFWPPCITILGKDKVLLQVTQKGVGKPTKRKGGGPATAAMQR